MTHLIRKETSLSIATALFIAVLIVIALSSCRGPVKHLQLSGWHKQQAIKKGAHVKMDTITFHFKSPEIKFKTTIKPVWLDDAPVPLWRDTLISKDKKTGATVKAKIDLKPGCPEDCIEKVYL